MLIESIVSRQLSKIPFKLSIELLIVSIIPSTDSILIDVGIEISIISSQAILPNGKETLTPHKEFMHLFTVSLSFFSFSLSAISLSFLALSSASLILLSFASSSATFLSR